MDEAVRFEQAVRDRAQGTPYVVERTTEGFDLRLDVTEPQWQARLHRARVRQVFTHHVRLDPAARRFVILDEVQQVEWRAGSLHLVGEASRIYGRVYERSSRKRYGATGDAEEVARFDSRDGHRIVRRAAEEVGWTERMPAAAKVGLVMGVVGAAGAVVTVVALLVALGARLVLGW